MSNSVDITDYPYILSDMLYRPSAVTIARWVIQPKSVFKPDAIPGQFYLMDRFGFIPDTGDMELDFRTRSETEIIGTANTRQIPRQKIPVMLREITGPSGGDPNNPGLPGNFRFSIPAMRYQQRVMWDAGFANPLVEQQFHDSVGASTLLMDYKLTTDRFYINALDSTTNKYNPNNVADGGTYASGPPTFTVSDLDAILEQLIINKAPTMSDNFYHALITPRMWRHLRADNKFQSLITSSAYYSVPMIMANQDWIYGPGAMPGTDINYVAQPNIAGFMPYYNQVMPGDNQAMLPGGYVYNQFRIWVSNNIPVRSVTLTYTASTDTTKHPTGSAARNAYSGYFFGQQSVGELLGGSPEDGIPCKILTNKNSDYDRFLIVIWQAFLGLTKLNDDFIIAGRTYAD